MTPRRAADNPIITPAMLRASRPDFEIVGVFNPAAIQFGDEMLLLLRVAEAPIDRSARRIVAPVFDVTTGDLQLRRWEAGTHGLDVSDPRVIVFEGKSWLTSISHFRVARSRDGVRFEVSDTPAFSA